MLEPNLDLAWDIPRWENGRAGTGGDFVSVEEHEEFDILRRRMRR